MKTIFLNTIQGKLPDSSQSARPRQYSGGVLLRIDAAQIQARGGPAVATNLERYFAAEGGSSPLRLAVMAEDGSGVQEHIEDNKQRIDALYEDCELQEADRREMASFLAEMNHKLQNTLLGRGELPVIFN